LELLEPLDSSKSREIKSYVVLLMRGDGHDQSTLVGKGLTRTVIEQPGAACGVSVFGKVPHMVHAGGRVTQHRLCLDRHYTRNNWDGYAYYHG
jgi:hypothetical protein